MTFPITSITYHKTSKYCLVIVPSLHICTYVPCTYPMTSGGRRGAITDLLTTSRHPFRSFDTLRDSVARRQVQSLILSSHRFLWPPLLLPPLTVPCMIVFERPEDLETWPYHFSFLLLTVVSKSSYGPMARSILLRTSTFVVFCVRYVEESSVASHLHCLYSTLQVGGECPAFACI